MAKIMNSAERKKATADEVSVRAFLPEDILPLVDYWTENSEEFWRERGVDKSKLLNRPDFIARYEDAFREKGGVPGIAVILFRGNAIGVHTLTSIEERESAVFHAHIWGEEHRRLGVGVYSYLKAADFFFRSLGLKKLIFKTPKLNRGAHRVKEKIGIPAKGDIVFEAPVLIAALPATLFELDRELLEQLKNRHGI